MFAFIQETTAGQFNNAKIDTVATDSSGITRVTLIGGTEVSPKAACSSSADGRQFTYDLNSPSGSGWHSIVLSALAAQKEVHFVGKNTCLNIWSTMPFEETKTIYILNK